MVFSPCLKISGAIQLGVPTEYLDLEPKLSIFLDKPKSATLIFQFLSIKIFELFKSQWRIPFLCVYYKALIILIIISKILSSGKFYLSPCKWSNKLPFSKYSATIIHYPLPLLKLNPMYNKILGCLKLPRIFTSLIKLSSNYCLFN